MMEAYRSARLRAELDLRALSGRPPPGAGQRCRLGRIERRGLLQFGARRAHQPLRRFPRHRLRHRRPRARLRPASAGEPPRDGWCSTSSGLRPRLPAPRMSPGRCSAACYGREVGDAIGVVDGLSRHIPARIALKAFGAAAASAGAVGLFHVAGVTPEAPDAATALGGAARRDGHPRDAGDGRDAARAGSRRPRAAERDRRGRDRQPASVARRVRRAGAAARRAPAARAALRLHRPPCAWRSSRASGRRDGARSSRRHHRRRHLRRGHADPAASSQAAC